jgi:N utilization substance protein B
LSSYFEETDAQVLDFEYLDAMEQGILEKQGILGHIISKLAPKFDIETMSVLNLIPMYIALYEAIFLTIDAIPDKVSVNEAIELTKKFSDETGRMLVNGVLSNFLIQRANFPKDMVIPESPFHLFP